MLNLIQQALELEGFCFERIDGKTSLEDRGEPISQFEQQPEMHSDAC